MHRKTRPVFWMTLLVLGLLLSACSGSPSQSESHAYELAPMADMPAEVHSAPEVVRSAYQFAVANPDVRHREGAFAS